jgi:hypothetical protein
VKACHRSPFVLDRSKDLGKWTAGYAHVVPPLIHQPTSDFDELYDLAVEFNDVFQQWIESFFIRKGDPSKFVYISNEDTKSGQYVFRIPNGYASTLLPSKVTSGQVDRESLPFQGDVDRGPVKRPHRSIAKVCIPSDDVFHNNVINVLQVYRSYRRDVTLLTDIVRCAVRFATPKELLHFVKNWLFIYGEPQRPQKKPSMKKRLEKQFLEFKSIVHDFFHPDSYFPGNASSPDNLPPNSERAGRADSPGVCARNEQDVDCDCTDCVNSQRQHTIFEILRIRNRLDPNLTDVPGGYRDFALKIKIGFSRWT